MCNFRFLFESFQMSRTLESSPNALINKKILDRYLTLELPENKIQATYIWIDGTDQYVRCKDRTLDFVPKSPKGECFYPLRKKNKTKTHTKLQMLLICIKCQCSILKSGVPFV